MPGMERGQVWRERSPGDCGVTHCHSLSLALCLLLLSPQGPAAPRGSLPPRRSQNFTWGHTSGKAGPFLPTLVAGETVDTLWVCSNLGLPRVTNLGTARPL